MGNQLSALVFQPPEITYTHSRKPLIWLTTRSNRSIPAFYIDRKAKVTILFSHGNAEDLGNIYEWFLIFSLELNVNLLAYDYEGYGKTTGSPSELACYEDIDAAYTYLIQTLNQVPENIVLYGRSLGTGPSAYLAERLSKQGVQLGGVILQVFALFLI
jgi:pimeloyl-ACP methyl ester carboxylesterase